jgi:Protein of unknown function (DUF3309)
MARRGTAVVRTVLLIFVVLLLLGSLPAWPYSAHWGYYPSGGLGALLLILIVLMVLDVF